MNESYSFSSTQFDRIFPFHIRINRNLQLTGLGKSLIKMLAHSDGSFFNDTFSIPRPHTLIATFDDLITIQDKLIVLQSVSDAKLILRGQFELLNDRNEILFIGTPWFSSMEQITKRNMVINDFAKHDVEHNENPKAC